MSMVDVLPAPLGPRNATISPGPTRRSSPATAVTSANRFTRPRNSIAAAGPPVVSGDTSASLVVLIPVSMPLACPVTAPKCHAKRHQPAMTSVIVPPSKLSTAVAGNRSAADEPGGEPAFDLAERNPLLGHGVPAPDRDGVVL